MKSQLSIQRVEASIPGVWSKEASVTGDQMIVKSVSGMLASVILAALALIAGSPAASAVDYSASEQAAWNVLKKNPIAKVGRKQIGKYKSIQMMYRVCEMMDDGDDWDDISDWWIGVSMTAASPKQQRDFLGYGAAVSGSALRYICPWNLVGTPFAR